MSASSPVIDISLDFDYFIREEQAWDWGHRDSGNTRDAMIFKVILWQLRYQQLDLYNETDPAIHADYKPQDLLQQLFRKNLYVPKEKYATIAIADSHRHAYDFFDKQVQPDILINIDAHHDLYVYDSGEGVNCGNWLTALRVNSRWSRANKTSYVQIYPKWKDLKTEYPAALPINRTIWSNWQPPENSILRNIFLCRSSEWIAPHHDAAFLYVASMLKTFWPKTIVLEDLVVRPFPTREEAKKQYDDARFMFETITNVGK